MLGFAYRTTLIFVNIILAALLILSAYGYFISPQTSVIPAYVGLAFPLFFVVNVLFVLFWLMHRSKRFSLISLLTLLACTPSIIDYSPLHIDNPNAMGRTLNLMTYNVHSFGGYKNKIPGAENPIISYITSKSPDIVCLQEYSISHTGELLTRKEIDELFSDYKYSHYMPLNTTSYSESGLAVYSKFPIIDTEEIKYKESFNGVAIYKIKIFEDTLTLVNCHLESNKLTTTDRELYSYMVKNMETSLLSEVNERLVGKMNIAYRMRAKQAEDVSLIVKSTPGHIIVCGDFNDTPQSYAYHRIKGNLKDAFVHTGTGPGITYNSNFFWFRIDHILYSSQLKPILTTIGELKTSDHYPVTSLFQWDNWNDDALHK